MPVIETEKLGRKFGDFEALKAVSLSVDKGEFFGLLGPNGAGKTTLVRILTGQLEPSSGKAETMGVGPENPIGIKRKIGIVPEAESPPTFLTAQEFLELVCRVRNVDEAGKKVARWLDFFQIREKKDVLCRDLSKGQRQKVMLAAAFIHEPELLILDEPFINLDPIFQRKLREYLQGVTAGGRTVFMCSHILEIVEKLCTRVAVINQGRIVAQGKFDEIREKEGEDLEDIFMRLVEGNGENGDAGGAPASSRANGEEGGASSKKGK
jgi:ABC-2 type transport system ATP-binding protein